MFQTRMAEARKPTISLTDNSAAAAAAAAARARVTSRGDYHATFEMSLIVGSCVIPWYTSDMKGQLF